ncbi:MAG TPA: hypothetical protein PLO53_13105 [Candidatus Hydrogenedentes bacterium]|nr:hypothetical protein [Candidatus Hydrogenedentota bacterium]
MTLPAGMYQLWTSLMGPVPSERYLIAPLTLSVNGAEILSLKNLPAAQESRNTVDADTKSPPSWQWYPGSEAFTVNEGQLVTLRASAEPLPGPEPGWINWGDLLIAPADCGGNVVHRMEVTLEPGDEIYIPDTEPEDCQRALPRFDVWVRPTKAGWRCGCLRNALNFPTHSNNVLCRLACYLPNTIKEGKNLDLFI